jgi:hypothetical protein
MEKERDLVLIADEKIKLAKEVVVDETENYSFGKVTLNDFIQAVNTLDNNRFSKVTHSNKLRTLKVEWMRLTDQLINRHKGD